MAMGLMVMSILITVQRVGGTEIPLLLYKVFSYFRF